MTTSGTTRITVLGSGTSHGVPMIGCLCPVCQSEDPRDKRWRPSIFIEFSDGFSALVDTTPDLRAQALRFNVSRVDAIVFTHSHADHVMGLDEVRRFNMLQKSTLPCYGDERTIRDIRRTFSYVFNESEQVGGGVPQLELFRLVGPFCLGKHEIVPVPILHGSRPILGFRVGSFAYLTDTNHIPDSSWPLLENVQILILDALRHRPHPTHFSVAQALEVVNRLGATHTYLTHICHDLPHRATCAQLPAGVELAYDGLILEVPAS